MIKQLMRNDCRKTLFECYTYFNDRGKACVRKEYEEWKPQKNVMGDYYQYCEGVLSGAIINDADVELEIIIWLSTMIENSKKEDKSGIQFIGGMNYSDIVKELVNLYLNDKLTNIDNLKNMVYETDDEMSKWLLNLNNFDYNKFECSWLVLCGGRLLKSIAENQEVKQNIISSYKKQYDYLLEADKVNDIIIKYFI